MNAATAASGIRVWAPCCRTVRLHTDDIEIPMDRDGDWFVGPQLAPGTDYAFVLDDSSEELPDPTGRWLPNTVHGRTRVYDDDAYQWGDSQWRGRDLMAAVIYELHIGTFTPGATFDSAIERLAALVELGVTHVEVLPINAFNGVHNWGYDGVAWYAVHEPYGGPDGFKRFVDACHQRGLAVILDVVYNHLGPSGNYLPRFGPYLKQGRNTWGDLVNLEEPEVRKFVIDNALMWLRDFHVDGLRIDAVHALIDTSPVHVLAELSEQVEALAATLQRPLTLIGESDLNDPVVIEPRPAGWGLSAQWNDDVHHAWHSALTGETHGYYCDFGSLAALAKVYTSAFLHDGSWSTFRGRPHGRPIDQRTHAGWQFVVCLQNHDQVGNRAAGDRLAALTTPELVKVGAVLLLTSPFTPMIWMGEEWGSRSPWPFFTSHPQPELAEATARGRVEEFAQHDWDVAAMPNPQDPETYYSAILDWDEPSGPGHSDMLSLYRHLIALRRAEPDLGAGSLEDIVVRYDEDERWLAIHRGWLVVAANFSDRAVTIPEAANEVVLATGDVQCGRQVALAAQSAAILRRDGGVPQG